MPFTRTLRLGLAIAVALVVAAGAAATAQPVAGKSPGETYVAYRAAMQKAKAIEELAPWLAKDSRAKIDEMPANERPMIFEMIKEMSGSMSDVKVLSEKVDGETVELAVEAMADGAKTKGSVKMAKEDGAWRIVAEIWGSGM